MNYYHYIIIAIAILYLISKIYPWYKRKKRGYVNYINPDDLKKRIDNKEEILIVDVRDEKSHTGLIGHIEGSINIPYRVLEETITLKLEEVSDLKDTPVVVTVDFDDDYGFQSYIIFLKYGFKEVYLLDNGLSAWIKKGYFVTKEAST